MALGILQYHLHIPYILSTEGGLYALKGPAFLFQAAVDSRRFRV